MDAFIYILAGAGTLLFTFAAVIFIRTLLFRPKTSVNADATEVSFDTRGCENSLRELIKCRTVSNCDRTKEDDREFDKFLNLLPKLYPNVYKKCTVTLMDDRALLFKWQGIRSDSPVVLMAHYDVVPVNEDGWEKPPFDGILENAVLWGRGTLDTKVTVNAILFSANHLIAEGFVPEQDIYFAFSGGEEVSGDGAANIVSYFEKNSIAPSFVLDEGGAVVENVFPGVKGRCGLIGIAEKGMMDLEYKVKSNGGHASAPKPHTPVGVLAKACYKLESRPFTSHLTKPVSLMFDTLGRHSTFLYRMIFANLWCFRGILDIICKKRGGELNALMRTTVAFTQMNGSNASNVIPPEASMVSNIRLNPSDTIDSAIKHIEKTIDDPNVELAVLRGMNPSPISVVDSDGYKKISEALRLTWEGSIVSPYLMVQCSDSRHWGRISDRVYRFSAIELTSEERGLIHANNERIRIENIHSSCEFYMRLIKKC